MYHHAIDVRYGEVDRQGVVFNANYLAYCDHAFDTWLRQLAPSFEDDLGWDVMLKAASLEWHGTAGVGDTVDLVLRVERWGRTSFDVAFEGYVIDRSVVAVRITYVVVTSGDHQPLPIPDDLRAHLGG